MSVLSILIVVILCLTFVINGFIYLAESDKYVSEVSALDKKLSKLRSIKLMMINDIIGCALMILLNHNITFNLLLGWVIIPLCVISAVISSSCLIVYFYNKS